MRPGTTFPGAFHNPTASPSPSTSPDRPGLHSTWNSPVPYLFGGLAAMLGLIALALLTLACTYWRLNGYLQSTGTNGEQNSNSASQTGKAPTGGDAQMAPPVQEHVAVIMAGEAKPTYLATPVQRKDGAGSVVIDVGLDLERGRGATVGEGNQRSDGLNQQQLALREQ